MTRKKLIRILNNRAFFLLLYAAILVFALIPYYTNGCLILGGEGNYVLSFSTYLGKCSFTTWFSDYSVGIPNMSPSGVGLNIILLSLIEKISGSIQITNFILIFSIYFLPFLGMFLVGKQINATPFISFAISLFYVINPFMLNYLTSLNQWNVFSVSAMPFFLWSILKYYKTNFKLFFCFGFISMCFSLANTNQPMLVIIQVSISTSILFACHYFNSEFIFREIFKKYFTLIVSFILFNAWWILTLFMVVPAGLKYYTRSFAVSWLNITVADAGATIAKAFTLSSGIPNNPSYNFFNFWYNTVFARFMLLVPIFIVVYFVLLGKNSKARNLLNMTILAILLVVLFFAKGNGPPFGFIYNFMFRYVPLFYIFKSPLGKFGLLYIFILSILLLFIMADIRDQKFYRHVRLSFIFYLFFLSVPIITGNIIPDYSLGDLGYASKKYKDKEEYVQFRREVNDDISEYRILSLPGTGNYQLCFPNYGNKHYTGIDPVLMNTKKPFIAPEHNLLLYDDISSNNYRKLLGIYNIRKIMINEDLVPWFGNVGIGDVQELKNIFSEYMISKTWGSVALYDNKDNFLPRIYGVSTLTIKE